MILKLATAPTEEPITRTEVEEHLRLINSEASTESESITRYITAARIYCENLLNKSLITQTWDLYLDYWPQTPFEIPLPPLQSVSYIHYTTSALAAGTVATTVYRVDANGQPGRINLAYGQSWPWVTLDTLNGINIRFVSGYGTASSITSDVKNAMHLIVGHLYENRETTIEKALSEIPLGAKEFLEMYRLVEF